MSKKNARAKRGAIVAMAGALFLAASSIGLASPAVATLSCASGGVCQLGDTGPGGGKVFFVKGSGAFSASHTYPATGPMCPPMCGSPTTLTVSLTSGEQAALPFDYLEVSLAENTNMTWSSATDLYIGTNSENLGTGQAGTNAILATYIGVAETDVTNAARFATQVQGGYSDWYLPSIDELELIDIRQADGVLGTSFSGGYWNTRDTGTNLAYKHLFASPYQSPTSNYTSNKSQTGRTLAIRGFIAVGQSSSSDSAPPDVLQHVGLPKSGSCADVDDSMLNWAGVNSGGWTPSWAQWINEGSGGAICGRTLYYAPSGRWAVRS